MEYKLLVLTPDKVPAGEARSRKSLQWREAYAGSGEAKLVCAATPNNLGILQEGSILQLSDRPESLAVILAVKTENVKGKATMTVRAKPTACRLADRVLMHTREIDNAEAGMLSMASDNLRGLPLAVAPAKGLSETYGGQISWGSVLEAEEKVAEFTGLGFRVVADGSFAETFEVYRGKDRTDPESADYVGYFSDSAKMLSNVSFETDISELRNAAVVAGEGEGPDRVVVEVDESAGGEKRELFVDASDIQSTYKDQAGTEHTMTAGEYQEALRARGREKLAETRKGIQLSAEISQTNLLYGRDYGLGDILPLKIEKYGLSANVRLTEATLIYEQAKTINCKLEVVS